MKTTGLQFDEYLNLLRILVREPCVVGAEEPFFRVLHRELEARGASVRRYLGLLVAEGSQPDSIMFSAHVDRHGLICTGPDEFQYSAFVAKNRSDLNGDSISEQTVKSLSERFIGEIVSAYDPWSGGYLGQAAIEKVYHCSRRDNLIFRVSGLGTVGPGTPVAYLDQLQVEDSTVTAQLDNVLTVAALIHLFDLGFQGRVFLSAQEEAGRSWRYILEWFLQHDAQTDSLFVVDTSPYSSRAEADAQDIVLRRRDAGAEFHPKAIETATSACNAVGARATYKDEWIAQQNIERAEAGQRPLSFGRTELGRLVASSDGRVTGATIQAPTTGYHTKSEKASINAVQSFLAVVEHLSTELHQ